MQASSPPMLHYAFGMDIPIHTRNIMNDTYNPPISLGALKVSWFVLNDLQN